MSVVRYFYQCLMYTIIYLPLIVIIIFSFNNSTHSLLWHGMTFQWYKALFQDTELLTITMHSLVIAILASTTSCFLATLAAICIQRFKYYGRHLLAVVFFLIMAPDIVIAVALLMVFQPLINLGFWTILIAHITLCLPFTTFIIFNRLSTLSSDLTTAARDLGATEIIIMRKIILPLVMPGIIAAWLISFTLSIDDVMISFFVSGPSFQILPLKIYSLARQGVNPELNALCTVMLFLTLLTVILSHRLVSRTS